MLFEVNKDELVLTLECLLETQEAGDTLWGDTFSKASDMLLTITRFPVECKTITLSEDEAQFFIEACE